jgi:hypothetical protein
MLRQEVTERGIVLLMHLALQLECEILPFHLGEIPEDMVLQTAILNALVKGVEEVLTPEVGLLPNGHGAPGIDIVAVTVPRLFMALAVILRNWHRHTSPSVC